MTGFSSAILVGVVSIAAFAPRAAAQGVAHGFVYGGPTAIVERGGPSLATFGGGGDFLARNGAGGSFEFGRLGVDNVWVNEVSADAMYQRPLSPKSRVSPFVVGGYSGFFNGYGGTHGINFGGGANVWVHPRLAVRIEARDHVLPADGAVQALSFRFGVTFR